MNPSVISVLLLLGFMSSQASGVDRGTRERSFVQALERFDSAKSPDDYRDAAKILETILADGYRNGAVYYNLGNAWFRAGEYGRAILNYRKALPYRPRDPYLKANLEQALAMAPGRLPEPARPWWIHVLFWTQWLSYPTKVYCVVIMSSLGALTITLAVLLRRPRLYWVTVGFVLISIAIGIDAGLSNPELIDARRAVITGETEARKGMGTSYEPAFDQPLRDGAEFQVLQITSDWTFGHFEGIGDGWVRNEVVAR